MQKTIRNKAITMRGEILLLIFIRQLCKDKLHFADVCCSWIEEGDFRMSALQLEEVNTTFPPFCFKESSPPFSVNQHYKQRPHILHILCISCHSVGHHIAVVPCLVQPPVFQLPNFSRLRPIYVPSWMGQLNGC